MAPVTDCKNTVSIVLIVSINPIATTVWIVWIVWNQIRTSGRGLKKSDKHLPAASS